MDFTNVQRGKEGFLWLLVLIFFLKKNSKTQKTYWLKWTNSSMGVHYLCIPLYKKFSFIYRFQEEIYTTSFLTGAYLKSIGFKKKVYLYGTKGIADELANFGIDSIGLGVSIFFFSKKCLILYSCHHIQSHSRLK